MDLDDAKDVALEQYMEHLFKHKHCIPSVSKRLADIARLSIAEMRRQLEACEGRKIYSAYIAVTENYLIPFFGKYNIANINYLQVKAYEEWRKEKFDRELKASTVNTHIAAPNRVFDEAIAREYMQRTQVPVLTNTGRAPIDRPFRYPYKQSSISIYLIYD